MRMARRAGRTPLWLLALLLVVVATALAAVACGGDDDEAADTGGRDGTEEPVSGTISVAGVWTGDEQQAFRAVIDGFTADNPDATVNYQGAGDNLPTILATAIEGGNPPDIATVAQPGTIRDFVTRGALQPIEFAREDVEANFDQGLVDLVTIEGQLYGVLFKAANKSLGWYNVPVFEDAGVEPPTNFEELAQAAQTIKASGVTPFAVGADIGWPLTDLFENIYLRTAGPEMYDQLATHEIPWTDPSVIEALEQMRVIIGESDNLAGGTRTAVQTSFDQTVPLVFGEPPEASMLFEGDFVRTNINKDTSAEAGTGFGVFPFPAINGSPPVVVGAGDFAVMFTDSPVAQAFMRYLATTEAAEIWAAEAGSLSANKNLDPSVYPDDVTREIGTAVSEAESFRFDLSDLQPAAFGATAGQGMWKLFTDYLRDPSNPQAIAGQLEQAAARAYR
jgi:alpha-glucoside transport system substrate-binding protein